MRWKKKEQKQEQENSDDLEKKNHIKIELLVNPDLNECLEKIFLSLNNLNFNSSATS